MRVTEQASFPVDIRFFIYGSISVVRVSSGGFRQARRRAGLLGRRVAGRKIGRWPD